MKLSWLLALCAVAVLLATSPRVKEFVAVDRCLDSGGSYDYQNHRCDYQSSHLSPAGAVELPWVSGGGVVLAFVLLGGVVLLVRRGSSV